MEKFLTLLSSVLRKFGFFTSREILLQDQLSRVINGGTTTQYFNLERDTRQGDPISAYLFILTLEIYFFLLKSIPKLKVKKYLCTVFFIMLIQMYAICFFLQDSQSNAYLVEIFNTFSLFSGLKPNLIKCEIAGIGALKGI